MGPNVESGGAERLPWLMGSGDGGAPRCSAVPSLLFYGRRLLTAQQSHDISSRPPSASFSFGASVSIWQAPLWGERRSFCKSQQWVAVWSEFTGRCGTDQVACASGSLRSQTLLNQGPSDGKSAPLLLILQSNPFWCCLWFNITDITDTIHSLRWSPLEPVRTN